MLSAESASIFWRELLALPKGHSCSVALWWELQGGGWTVVRRGFLGGLSLDTVSEGMCEFDFLS
ncbi:hypothetical protein ACQP3D_28350, partial [Escherichia coli]